MITGLSHFTEPLNICEDCTINKQHRMSFPQAKLRRSRQHLEIVHSDIDDFSRKNMDLFPTGKI